MQPIAGVRSRSRRLFFALLFALFAVCLGATSRSTPAAVAQTGPLTLTLTTDKQNYAPGEEVRFTLEVKNTSSAPFTVTRPSAQAFDFFVRLGGRRPEPATPESLWGWSDNKRFAQATEQMIMEPGRTLTFSETWDQRGRDGNLVAPGVYAVQGVFVTNENIQPVFAVFTIGQGGAAPSQATAQLTAVGTSGVTGTATLTAQGDGTQAALDVRGLPAGATAQVRLTGGTCAQPGASSSQLPDLRADSSGRAQGSAPVLFRGTDPVALSTFTSGDYVITISLASGVAACGPVQGASMGPSIPPESAWFSAPPGSSAARPTCSNPDQWVLLYWGGANNAAIATAAASCTAADRYWISRSGSWLGFSPVNAVASDTWMMQTGEAVFVRGSSGPQPVR